MSYTKDEENLITLCAMEDAPYKAKKALLDGLKKSDPDFGRLRKILIKKDADGVYNKVKENFFSPVFRENLFEGLEKRGIKCLTALSGGYPKRLLGIPTPPVTLFYKGDISLLYKKCFAMVGSRRTPPNMLAVCKKTAAEIKEHFTVISGCATGADCAALEGADYRAVSVIPYGFDHLKSSGEYPAIKKVEENGLIISEYPPAATARTYYFPMRNRIIAGLSEGVLVVSAAEKSGALITAAHAANFRREVFAFPYSLGIDAGVGCNALIKDGAILTRNSLDIFSVFGIIDSARREETALTDDEKTVLAAIREVGDAFMDELAQKLDMLPHKIISVLSALEIKRCIVRLGGNRFAAL